MTAEILRETSLRRRGWGLFALLLLLLPLRAQTLRERTASVTLLKNEHRTLPIALDRQAGLTLVTQGEGDIGPLRDRLRRYGIVPAPEGKGLLLIVVTDGAVPPSPALDSLLSARQSVLLFLDRPASVAYRTAVTKAKAVALARPDSLSMCALADAVAGGIPFAGRLTEELPGLFSIGTGLTTTKSRLAPALPEDLDLDPAVLARIDTIAEEGLRAGAYPGCQVLVARDGYIVYDKAFGWKDARRREPNTTETLYDLASVTKATATVPLVMMADDAGKIRLQDRLDRHLDYLRWTNKSDVRLSQLLQHNGGLPAVIRFYEQMIDGASYTPPLISYRHRSGFPTRIDPRAWARSGFSYKASMVSRDSSALYPYPFARGLYLSPRVREMMRREIADSPRRRGGYRYSDIDFLLLQEVLEKVSSTSLDSLFEEKLARPLGLRRLCYNPLRRFSAKEIAEGQRDDFLRHQTLRGDVDDEAAAMLGGVSGNAGLFGNAESCAVICQMLLDEGRYGGVTFIRPETVRHYTGYRHRPSPYALGFDRQRGGGKGNTSPEASLSTYGHTGFTGTCFWVDPTNGLVYVFLSNRGAPTRWNPRLSRLSIRKRIQSVLYRALR